MIPKRLILIPFLSIVTLACILAIVSTCVAGGGTDILDPGFAERRSREFLAQASTRLATSEKYKLVEFDTSEVDGTWSLTTVARTNPSMENGDKVGSSGLIAIGHVVNGQWQFHIQAQDLTFDRWLTMLPKDLLDPDLRDQFRTFEDESSTTGSGLGKPFGSLANEQVFNLPFPEGVEYPITTLPNQAYHQGAIAQAIDFGMPEGSQLVAVAGGTVIGIKDDSNVGGCNKKFAASANFIRIRTVEGESILYLHTQVNSIKATDLKVGAGVEIGQKIAKSGSTGFTCNFAGTGPGPHLHIIREKQCGARICGSLPLIFAEFGNLGPKQLRSYESANLSPQKRARIEREKEEAREQKERDEIEETIDIFHSVFSCSTTATCDISQVVGSSVTANLIERLFPYFCFGCPEEFDENFIVEAEILPYELSSGGKLKVQGEEVWTSVRDGENFTQYTFVSHYLVKDNGVWKVDGYAIECGYAISEEGEIKMEKNLEGCPWQPPELPAPTPTAPNSRGNNGSSR